MRRTTKSREHQRGTVEGVTDREWGKHLEGRFDESEGVVRGVKSEEFKKVEVIVLFCGCLNVWTLNVDCAISPLLGHLRKDREGVCALCIRSQPI